MAEFHKHFFLSGYVNSEKYKVASKPGRKPLIPFRNRAAHSARLLKKFEEIWNNRKNELESRTAQQIATRDGTYLSFISAADSDLITKSLEHLSKGIRLLNIQEEIIDEQRRTKATIYIPNGMEGFFISKILKYQNESSRSGKPKNESLVNSIEDVSIALLEGLWTDSILRLPGENQKWCEAWLNVNTKDNLVEKQVEFFKTTLNNIGITYKSNFIAFPERAVLLINASRAQLIELMLQSDLLAEFRAGQEPAGFWVNESAIQQQEWVNDLLIRLNINDSNIKVCVLDTGVNNGHQLLQPVIDDANTLTVNPIWGTNDHEERSGHGTLMAGIATYGNLENIMLSTGDVNLTHRICSVKILPPASVEPTPKELWGEVTTQGVLRAEIQNPTNNLIFCLAITSKEDSLYGRPSSWSGAIDNLAYSNGDKNRLILISAGNVWDEEDWKNYPDSNFSSTIENPAQSWNALTVGAYTEKVDVNDINYSSYSPIAMKGQLSPYSTTSLTWERKWPIKPEIVFEGGNILKESNNNVSQHEDLELLSTSKTFNTKPFDTLKATSASTANASWFAAKIAHQYPDAWPETLRALMIHSANWNEAMLNQMGILSSNKKAYRNLLSVFGYGVPNLERALYSEESAFTFIIEEYIQPFRYNQNNLPETNEIHFYKFPWPKDLLLSMGHTPVKFKITLSYFIEPGAGEIGWKDKYRYQSHGLRFDVNNVNEEELDFRKRVNIEARSENDEINTTSGSHRWKIGTNNRSSGSVHSDFWEGTAADLATCNHIAIFPIIGWWRERKHLNKVENKTRYSLLISLETPAQDVQLYSVVKNMIEVPIEVST